MLSTLPLLVLQMKSLLPAPGAPPSPSPDQHCPTNITISEDEEWANITTLDRSLGEGRFADLLVHPDPGFKGLRLVTTGDGWQLDAWFTLDNTCFPRNGQWWWLNAGVWRERNDDNNNDGYLVSGVSTGACHLECRTTGSFLGAMNVTFMAQGPSRWRLENSGQCTGENLKPENSSGINCTTTTTTITTTTPTTTIVIIAVPVMIGVAGVVVLLVVVTKCYRQRRESPDVRMRFEGESEVVENSLYETLDNTPRAEVVENSLYETLDNTCRAEVVENSLYETLENTGGTEVVENSLYEPLKNVRKPR